MILQLIKSCNNIFLFRTIEGLFQNLYRVPKDSLWTIGLHLVQPLDFEYNFLKRGPENLRSLEVLHLAPQRPVDQAEADSVAGAAGSASPLSQTGFAAPTQLQFLHTRLDVVVRFLSQAKIQHVTHFSHCD
jgi:hypothetical protein